MTKMLENGPAEPAAAMQFRKVVRAVTVPFGTRRKTDQWLGSDPRRLVLEVILLSGLSDLGSQGPSPLSYPGTVYLPSIEAR